jgi:hypothetical protein
MASESRILVSGFRKYYEVEIEAMIRQMRIQGGTLDDCIAELRILANFVQSQADALTDAWPDLLKDTVYARSIPFSGGGLEKDRELPRSKALANLQEKQRLAEASGANLARDEDIEAEINRIPKSHETDGHKAEQ